MADKMTETRLQAIERRLAAVTPNWELTSWTAGGSGSHAIIAESPECSEFEVILDQPTDTNSPGPDIILAANAPDDINYLLSLVKECRGVLKWIQGKPFSSIESCEECAKNLRQTLAKLE